MSRPLPRIPCGRLRDGRLLIGLTPALLARLRTHGPQQLPGAGVGVVLVYGKSIEAIADDLAAHGLGFAATPGEAEVPHA